MVKSPFTAILLLSFFFLDDEGDDDEGVERDDDSVVVLRGVFAPILFRIFLKAVQFERFESGNNLSVVTACLTSCCERVGFNFFFGRFISPVTAS